MTQLPELNIYFKEDQRMTFWWVWALVLAGAGFAWWTFIQGVVFGQPVGDNPPPAGVYWAILLFVGIGMPLFMYTLKMTTTVSRERLKVRYWPLITRTIVMSEIKTFAACEYHPIRDYGGWGIRWGWGRGMAFSMTGNKGVQLELQSGKKILIGSHQANDLEVALKRAQTERQ